eukprot:363750-Chlamydomonas_euryale.AAC.4
MCRPCPPPPPRIPRVEQALGEIKPWQGTSAGGEQAKTVTLVARMVAQRPCSMHDGLGMRLGDLSSKRLPSDKAPPAPKLPRCRAPKLPRYRAPKLPRYRAPKLPRYRAPKLPLNRAPKLPPPAHPRTDAQTPIHRCPPPLPAPLPGVPPTTLFSIPPPPLPASPHRRRPHLHHEERAEELRVGVGIGVARWQTQHHAVRGLHAGRSHRLLRQRVAEHPEREGRVANRKRDVALRGAWACGEGRGRGSRNTRNDNVVWPIGLDADNTMRAGRSQHSAGWPCQDAGVKKGGGSMYQQCNTKARRRLLTGENLCMGRVSAIACVASRCGASPRMGARGAAISRTFFGGRHHDHVPEGRHHDHVPSGHMYGTVNDILKLELASGCRTVLLNRRCALVADGQQQSHPEIGACSEFSHFPFEPQVCVSRRRTATEPPGDWSLLQIVALSFEPQVRVCRRRTATGPPGDRSLLRVFALGHSYPLTGARLFLPLAQCAPRYSRASASNVRVGPLAPPTQCVRRRPHPSKARVASTP